MKRIFPFILILILSSCGSSLVTDREDMNLKGDVKSLKTFSPSEKAEYYFNEDGFLDSSVQIVDTRTMSQGIERDENNWVLKRKSYENDELVFVNVFNYNDDHTTATVSNLQTLIESEVSFNEKGQKLSETYVYGAEKMEVVYEYTENNKKKAQIFTLTKGQETQSQSVTYDYNEDGFVVKMSYKIQTPMGEQEMFATYSDFEVDEHGNWVSSKLHNQDGTFVTVSRTIEYY